MKLLQQLSTAFLEVCIPTAGFIQALHIAFKLLGHALTDLMQLHGIVNDGVSSRKGIFQPLEAGQLVLVDFCQGLAKGQELMIQRGVHLIHKVVDNSADPIHLRPGSTHQEGIHGVGYGLHGTVHGKLHGIGHLGRQAICGVEEHVVAILILADHLHIVVQGTLHGQLSEGFHKVVNGTIAGALQNAVQHVENQGAGNAGYRGAEGKTHAVQQHGNAVHQACSVGHIKTGQTLHQSDEGAQNTQGSQQAGNQLCQGGVAGTVGDRVIVDVVFHVAGQTTAIQLLGVLQEAKPAAFQPPPHKARLLPNGLFPILSGVILQATNGTAQGGCCAPQGCKTLEQPGEGDQGNGCINKVICQIGQQCLKGTHGQQILLSEVIEALYMIHPGM